MRVIELTEILKVVSIFLFISTVIGTIGIVRKGFYQESDFSNKAVFRVPDSSIDIVLERRNVHLFLAEYERTLFLLVNGDEVLQQKAALDTGGYSRMNVFHVSAHEYLLVGEFDFDKYLLDTSKVSFRKALDPKLPALGTFVGSFDRDEDGWRFIPVSERGIQTSMIDEQRGM